jgi:hypothetical protein
MNTPEYADVDAVHELLDECSRYEDSFIDEHSRYLRRFLGDFERYKKPDKIEESWRDVSNQFYSLRVYIDGLIHSGRGVLDARISGIGDQ